MNDEPASDLSFAALDALLDHALDLDEDGRAAFLDGVGPAQRAALLKLIDKSNASVLGRVGAQARDAIHDMAGEAAGGNPRAGEWQLKREIGAGGTGQVFYAERRDRHAVRAGDQADAFVQCAAVKVLWSHRVKSQFRDRFLRERRILASIDHPGLARFLDGGLLGDGRPWFAMEYVEGVSIAEFARTLPTTKRLELFVDVLDTIAYAHQRLIVHRDIKPQNILVDPAGRPRVLDFGIARILGESDEKDLTRAQGTPLTLQYASPEQVTGATIDVASDVYQLGLLLFELLTFARPYRIDESSLRAAIDTICRQSPALPSTRDRSIESDLDAIVLKALSKSPNDRYPSCAAFADDVRRFIDGRPVAARPQSNWYLLSRFLRRNALPATIAAASAVALTVATIWSVQSARLARAEAERSRATQEILAEVFEQTDPFGNSGANVSLADALIRAKPSIDAKIDGDPQLAWEVNRTLAKIFTNLDMQGPERQAFQAAWTAALKLDGNNERQALFGVAGLGNILARDDPKAAIEFLAKNLPPSPSNAESALEWLSAKYAEVNAFLRMRDFGRADSGAKAMDAVARRFAVDSPRTLSRIDQLLAGAAQRAGDSEAADSYWRSAVAHMRRADAPPGVAITLSNLALHYGKTGRFAQAEAAFQESISIFREHAPRDTSHANVQRLYAGLMFRMRRTDDALGALQEAQSILDPATHSYEYFVAQLERAGFAFVIGDIDLSLEAIQRGIEVAISSFGPDSDVTRRMMPVLARLLIFADRPRDAARLLMRDGVAEPRKLCTPVAEGVDVTRETIRVFDDAASEAARLSLWGKVDRAKTSDAFAEAVAAYRTKQIVFLDVLDRYGLLNALREMGRSSGNSLPTDLMQELEQLNALKATLQQLSNDDAGGIRALLTPLAMSERQFDAECAESAQPRVVSQEIFR